MEYIIWALGVYFFLVFVVTRLVVPFMGFENPVMPEKLPEEFQKVITEIEAKSLDQNQYLKLAYEFVTARWQGARFKTVYKFWKAWRTDLHRLWKEPGYAHCNTQNYILYVLLVKSKFFKPEDIRWKIVFLNMFIHQYLQVKVGQHWVHADPAGAGIRGIPLGRHISFFG